MRWSSPDGQTPPTAPGEKETQTRQQSGTTGGEGVAPSWSSTATLAVVIVVIFHRCPSPHPAEAACLQSPDPPALG